jgi:type I restriction enzyme S subunit
MTLDTFFEKFELLADAPDAVGRMRELIMSSAFSGRFSSEKSDQAVPDGWIPEGSPMLPPIPSSWTWKQGSEVFQVVRGVSYKKGDATDSPVDGSLPILRANNIGKGLNFENLVYVPTSNIGAEQLLRDGDIVIAMSSGSKKLVGKAAQFVGDFEGGFGAFCGVVRGNGALPNEVLARYFESPQYTAWVTAAGKGIGINNLGKRDLELLPVPIPPLAEQKRIVAKVEELMALCDRLEAQQQERATRHAALARASLSRFAEAPTPANLNLLFHPSYDIPPAELRKAILTLAVQGKLVTQDVKDRKVDSVGELRRASAELANSRGIRSPRESAKVLEPPFEIPADWIWVTLADVGVAQTGTTPSKDDPTAFNGDIPFVKPADIYFNTINYSNESLTRKGAETGSRLAPAGSLLMVCIGTIGKCNITERECAFNQQINSLSPVDAVVPRYLLMVARSSYFQEAAWARSASTTIAILNKGNWLSIPVPIPPLAEQRRIVAKVEQLMAMVDALEARLTTSRESAGKLLEAVAGELTKNESR